MIIKVFRWFAALAIGAVLIPLFVLKVLPAAYTAMMNVTLSESWLIILAAIFIVVWAGVCIAGAIDETRKGRDQ